jgi:signal peptidase I
MEEEKNQIDTIVLDGDLDNKKAERSPFSRFFHHFMQVFWVLFFVGVISVSSQIIYDYSRYVSFYVSGDSMYPTFNKEATRSKNGVSETASSHHGDWGDYDDVDYDYICDYGLMDNRGDFVSSLKRFDIVACYFNDDYSSLGTLNEGAEMKVKRLYGFPGETIYFSSSGDFYVDGEKAEQPSIIVNDGHLSDTATGIGYGKQTSPLHLREGEYYVVGDNRRVGDSLDSRSSSEGPLGRLHYDENGLLPLGNEMIKGKAVAIIGLSKLSYNEKGVASHSLVWTSMRAPWDIKYL